MRHRLTHRKLNRPTPHRKAMLRNLVKDLLTHESIRTTEARAKEARRPAEHMITLGKNGSLHSRRLAFRYLNDKSVVARVFDDLAPQFADRVGGYTRITKIGPRGGDGAPMVQLELLFEELVELHEREKPETEVEEEEEAEEDEEEAGEEERDDDDDAEAEDEEAEEKA